MKEKVTNETIEYLKSRIQDRFLMRMNEALNLVDSDFDKGLYLDDKILIKFEMDIEFYANLSEENKDELKKMVN